MVAQPLSTLASLTRDDDLLSYVSIPRMQSLNEASELLVDRTLYSSDTVKSRKMTAHYRPARLVNEKQIHRIVDALRSAEDVTPKAALNEAVEDFMAYVVQA